MKRVFLGRLARAQGPLSHRPMPKPNTAAALILAVVFITAACWWLKQE